MRPRSSPASELARPCTSGLIFLHQAEIHAGRTTIWVCRRDERKFRETQIPKEAFQECFENWKKRCERCIKAEERTSMGTLPSSQKWENDLFKSFAIFTDRPRIYSPSDVTELHTAKKGIPTKEAKTVTTIYTDHICAVYRETPFILHHPQFSYLNYSPVALPSFLVYICLTVRCSSSWTVLHDHTAGKFYWTLYWHSIGQGHYCAFGTVVLPTATDDHSYIRWPVLPAWEHEWIYTPCNIAHAVCISSLLMWEHSVRSMDDAGYRHLTSFRPHTLTQTFVLQLKFA
jgi:hypothetical protein